MPTHSDKVRIQNALVDMAEGAVFYPTTYDGRKLNDPDLDSAETVSPASVAANEVGANFDVDDRYMRGFAQERTSWTWELILGFSEEVDASQAEESWLSTVQQVPANDAQGLAQHFLFLRGVSYSHPTRDGHTGTKITYTFDVERQPR